MISIHKKRLFRKPLVINHDNWTECSQKELLLLFKILESKWYNPKGRLLVRQFLSEPTVFDRFLIKGVKGYNAPDKQLRSMSIGQWAYIERKMFDISQDYSAKNAASLLACIYTDNKPFAPESITKRANKLENVNKQFVDATIFCWEAIRSWVYLQYPFVFPQRPAEIVKNAKPVPPEYIKIIRGFANGNSDEDLERIFHSKMHNILSVLNDELKPKR